MSVRDAPKAVELSTQSADPASVDPLPARPTAPPVRDPRRYEVIGEHGRGGLGRVQRVRDHELGRDVAIKELLSRGPVSERRFEREARITARLEHPGIVPLYEAGRWPDGTPFYAMKLVAGRPLRALIAERTTVDERIGLLHHVIAVADAMAYAHGRNIIHRDLKPGNVIVGDFGETVVIDWGLAKDLSDSSTIGGADSGSPAEPDLTTAGSVLGTPAYMPPEQERGEAVDQRADVFAIGAMLWELCSLHRVPPGDLRARHRQLRDAGIDDDLIAIVDKAIDPDPTRRYRDAGEMAADLRSFKSSARISARRYSLAAVLRHWTRRHRALALLAFALTTTVVIGIAALAWLYRDSEANAALAHQQLTQSYVEQGRRALLDDRFTAALPFLVEAARRGDHSTALRFMLERAAEPLEHEVLRLPAMSPRAWCAKFSRDGRRILSCDDGGGRIWDARTGRLLFSMPHKDTVFSAQFVANETRVITYGYEGIIRLWDAQTGALVREMEHAADAKSYRGFVVSPDEKYVAARGDNSGDIGVWFLETGALVAHLRTKIGSSSQLTYSSDGHWLAASDGEAVQIFDTKSWKPATRLNIDAKVMRFDPTGPRLATGTRNGDLAVWDVMHGQRIQQLLLGGEEIASLAFSRDGSLLAAGFGRSGGFELIWQAQTGVLQTKTTRHGFGSSQLELDGEGRLLLGGGTPGQFAISDARSGVPLLQIGGSPRLASELRFSSDARQVIGAMLDGSVRVWMIAAEYRMWGTGSIGRDCGTDVMPEEDSRLLAVSCGHHTTRLWDSASNLLVAELPASHVPRGFPDPVPAVAASSDAIAIARDDRVEVYELPSKRLRRTVQHPAIIKAMRFARDHTLVTASIDGTLTATDDMHQLWTISAGSEIDAVVELPNRRLLVADATPRLAIYSLDSGNEVSTIAMAVRARALRVSRDGRRAVTIPPPGRVDAPALFDLSLSVMVSQLTGHSAQVYSAQFVNGDRTVLTAGADGVANLWDADTGQIKTRFTDDTILLDAALSRDGSLLVTAGGDGYLRFWSVGTARVLWKLRAHTYLISGVHFEGDDLVSRGWYGDLAKWRIPPVRGGADWLARFEKLVANGPWRLDTVTGALVANAGRQ